jgi:hypothetical protein
MKAKLLLLLAAALLVPFPASALKTLLPIGGGDTAMLNYCREGGSALGYNAAGDCYAASCGNYNWSGLATYATCTDDATPDDACLVAGERIKTGGVLQDIVLATQNTCKGGTIYLPKFAGYDHGIYPWRGCDTGACVTDESGAHNIRHISMYGGRRLLGEGVDTDGPEVGGRTGTWLLNDGGLYSAGTDPDASGAVIADWAFRTGLESQNRTCVLAAGVCDPDDATLLTRQSETLSLWGTNTTITDDVDIYPLPGDHTGQYVRMCLDNGLANTGTCSGDRRVACSVTATDCTPAGLGTCEGFVTALETDLAAGESRWLGMKIGTQTWDLVTGLITNYPVVVAVHSADDAAASGCTADGKNVTIGSDVGATGYLRWPFPTSTVDVSVTIGEVVRVIDVDKWDQGGGYSYEAINFMPQNWFGRDSTDNIEDCLSVAEVDGFVDGDVSVANDEINSPAHAFEDLHGPVRLTTDGVLPAGLLADTDYYIVNSGLVGAPAANYYGLSLTQGGAKVDITGNAGGGNHTTTLTLGAAAACDTSEMFGLMGGYNGGFNNVTVRYASAGGNSNIDGDVQGILTKFHNSLYAQGKQGLVSDASNWDFYNNTFKENTSASGMINIFTHNSTFKYQTFIDNNADYAFKFAAGSKGALVDNIRFWGGNRFNAGLFRIKDGHFHTISNVIAQSVTGRLAVISPDDDDIVAHLTMRNIKIYGVPNMQPYETWGSPAAWGAIVVSDDLSGGDGAGDMRHIIIDNVVIEGQDDIAFLWVDAGDDDAAGGAGANLGMEDDMHEITIMNSSLESTSGKFAVFSQEDDNTAAKASDAVDIFGNFTTDPTSTLPFLFNNQLNGANVQDFPYHVSEIAAAAAGDCNTIPHNTIVLINDDTGVGNCADAGTDGVLDGGGASKSVCICNRETALWFPYF